MVLLMRILSIYSLMTGFVLCAFLCFFYIISATFRNIYTIFYTFWLYLLVCIAFTNLVLHAIRQVAFFPNAFLNQARHCVG